MNRDTRIEKIEQITKKKPFGNQEIPWKDKLVSMSVYQIPLEYLVYNKYNGRILSRTKSIESQKQKIDAESEEGRKLIEKLLWDSKPDRNRKTLESINKIGQERVGIITKDGIIIDGNRRVMLLARANSRYFKTVVLPETLEENPLEIEKLETSFQMGEDEKLGYNPIEKYLKAKSLYKQLTQTYDKKKAISEIANWMGESDETVKTLLSVMETMDDYLDYLQYNGIYTQLDGREDQLIFLTKWLKGFYGEDSSKAFDGYKDTDVDDLKMISFDYIRAQFEGKRFRYIADGLKENHFFGDKKIWSDFRDYHFKKIEKVKLQETPIDFSSEKLEAHLNARDSKYLDLTRDEDKKSFLDENIDSHLQQLNYKQRADEPAKLLDSAKKALEAIDQKHKAFAGSRVMDQVGEINRITVEMLQDKSSSRLLSEIIHLLELVSIGKNTNVDDELLQKVAKINKIAFDLKKQLGG